MMSDYITKNMWIDRCIKLIENKLHSFNHTIWFFYLCVYVCVYMHYIIGQDYFSVVSMLFLNCFLLFIFDICQLILIFHWRLILIQYFSYIFDFVLLTFVNHLGTFTLICTCVCVKGELKTKWSLSNCVNVFGLRSVDQLIVSYSLFQVIIINDVFREFSN